MAGSDGTPQPRRGDGSRRRHRGRGRAKNAGGRGAALGRGRGRGGGQPLNPAARDVAAAAARAHGLDAAASPNPSAGDQAAAGAAAADVCFICANPIAHHCIAPCNHTTCQLCGLRMRALYKTKDCTHCRTPAPFVVFTDDGEKRFEDYGPGDITTTDSKIGIKYTNEDIFGETVLLLRYNCPDPSCDFAGLGWPDLHRHVKSVHSKRMCDLCTRNKKVFTHEHELYTDRDLDRHMRHGEDKPGAADQTGFKGHPLCGFCGERFYDDDKLYEHCRMKHERCFICDMRDSRKPHYYRDYNALEQHFNDDHYLCKNSECLEKKFVVFESEMDLQAHQLSEHAGKAAGRDARVVDISAFDIRQGYQQERRGGGGVGRGQRDGETRGRGRNRGGGGRGRDPNGDAIPPTSAQPLRRDELAFQRQMAIHSAQSVSNRTFGGQLTPTPAQPSASRQGNQSSTPRAASSATAPSQSSMVDPIESLAVTDASALAPEERARLVRHSAVVERATNLLANDGAKVAEFRAHISSYRRGGLTAPQLIDAFFTIFGDVSNALGTLVREVADLYEDKAKADGLRKAWQDWRAINEDYPSLPGLSGMHGATSSSSGWATALAANPAVPTAAPSQKHSKRVLKLKNSTRLGGPTPSSPRGPPGWAAATKSSSSPSPAFPSLLAASRPAASSFPAPRPSWLGSAPQPTPPPPRTATGSSSGRGRGGGRGEDAFPALPAAPKPMTTLFGYGSGRGVRRDYGHAVSDFQWGANAASVPGGAAAAPASAAAATEQDDAESTSGGGKGKKGGKKGKKVLVQWG